MFERNTCIVIALNVKSPKQRDSDFHWITIANKPNKILDILNATAAIQGVNLVVLGQQFQNVSEPWLRSANCHLGFKLLEINNFVKSDTVKPDDIVLITEAFDVVLVGDIDTVIKRYVAMNVPVVFGAENGCWPITPLCDQLPFKGSPTRGLNSGTILGRAKYFRSLMADYVFDEGFDDQRYCMGKYIAHPDVIGLDHDRQLFLTLSWMSEDARNDMSWSLDGVFRWKDKTPPFVHRCGESKEWLDKSIKYLYEKYARLA